MDPVMKGVEPPLGMGVGEGDIVGVGVLADGAAGTGVDRTLFRAPGGVVIWAEF